MKSYYSIFIVVLVFLFSSFNVYKACEYAGSNINFTKKKIEKALAVEDVNLAHYHAYKALNTIEKSKYQLKECGCDYASESIADGLKNLKFATKATSLSSTRILLNKALENTLDGLEALQEHEFHNSRYASNVLVMNTIVANNEKAAFKKPEKSELESTIDTSLEKYRESLDKIVTSVDCKVARAFAENIYLHCEQQLLRSDLTEGKKYYNLRTKEITDKALEKLKDCN
ncbi:MAG: hypothetical protein KAJ23_03235 [Maribacter sp.]|nr:hypothetical protein [Maribacter sp.]